MPAETRLHLAHGYDEILAVIVRLVAPSVEGIEMHYRVGGGGLDDGSAVEPDSEVEWSAVGMLTGGAGLVTGVHVSPVLEHPVLGSILALVDLAGRLGVRVVIVG